jgi:hypothetical protein
MPPQQITWLTEDAIAVTTPEDIKSFDIWEATMSLRGYKKGREYLGAGSNVIELPPGNWSILGLSTQLSEDEFEKVVREKFWIGGFGWMYTNYTDEVTLANEIWKRTGPFKTAAESATTLLKSKGITSPVLILIKK